MYRLTQMLTDKHVLHLRCCYHCVCAGAFDAIDRRALDGAVPHLPLVADLDGQVCC